MIYDTLKLAKALRVSFTPEQSETLARAFSEGTEDSVATKLDIAGLKTKLAELEVVVADLRAELRTEIAAVRTGIADLRAELRTEIAAVRTEIADLRTELRTEIAAVRTEIAAVRTEIAAVRTEIAAVRTEIASIKGDMIRWIVGAIAFNLLATLGTMIAVAELVLKVK